MIQQGIYQIRNTANGKVYIGSSGDIKMRWEVHKKRLRSNHHNNKHLQKSWSKYGEEDFAFEKIEDVNREQDLLPREQWFLDNKIRWGVDYNISRDALAPMAGRNHSAETIGKMSRAKAGEKCYWFGKTHSPKTKQKMSNAKSGEKCHNAKLTEKEVLEVRRLWKTGEYKRKELSDIFKVRPSTISQIVHRKTWKHI